MTDSSLLERAISAMEAIATELKRANDATEAENDRVVGCTEAAKLCGVSPQTISVWVRTGKLRKVYKGGKRGVLLSELPLKG